MVTGSPVGQPQEALDLDLVLEFGYGALDLDETDLAVQQGASPRQVVRSLLAILGFASCLLGLFGRGVHRSVLLSIADSSVTTSCNQIGPRASFAGPMSIR